MQNNIDHNYYLNIIRRMLKASFVGWVTRKDKKSLKVVVNKKEHLLPLEGEIGHETYTELIKELLRNEERGNIQEPV